jgi:hypothetical protein
MPSQQNSWVWSYDASDKPSKSANHTDKDGRPGWKCRPCSEAKFPKTKFFLKSGGTGGPKRHLQNKHKISRPSLEDTDDDNDAISTQQTPSELSSRPGSIAMAFQQIDHQRPRKRPRITKLEDVNEAHFSELFQNYIVECSLPFRHVEAQSFKDFIEAINPFAAAMLPKSHTTVSNNIFARYEEEKRKIRALLSTSLSRIHISVDNWTCENAGKAYMGITARFANREGRQQVVLAIKPLLDFHSGENMAGIFLDVAHDFNVDRNIGFCNADNASSNDTMAGHIEDVLEKEGLEWDAGLNRLRCVGHIINLSIQALLFGKHPNQDCDPGLPSVEDVANWRKTGSLGILHDLIIWICKSPQRRKAFHDIAKKGLVRDNNTRWTSWYDAIIRALELQPAVEMMQLAILSDRKIKQADRPPMLQAEDWDTLKVYKDFLEPYRDAILETEGYEDGLNLVLQAMDELLEKLEQGKIDHAADAQFSASIETSWNVMEKYYKLTDESPAYSAAVVMDPRWKWAYFETYWATDFLKPYVRKAKTSVSLHSIETLESIAKIDRHAIFGPNSINTGCFLQCRPKIRPQYR